jgi:hypothetical protein
MKQSEVIELIKGRDRLIEGLILSHLQTLGRVYSIESTIGMNICQNLLLNPFALDDLVDDKRGQEINFILQDGNRNQQQKVDELLNDKRILELAGMLKDLARKQKSKLLKKLECTDYQTKY